MNPVLHIVADLSSGSSVLVIAGTLFLIPFIHEDIAIIAAALLVAQHRLSIELAFASVFLGMVGRDLLLYGLGALARYNALARRYLIRPRVQELRSWLDGKMIWVILVGRVVPGLMFPTYIAIGQAIVLAVDAQHSAGLAIGGQRHRQDEIESQHPAEGAAMRGDVLARRQKGDGAGQHIGQAAGDGSEDGAGGHIGRILDAIGLQDEHPPVPAIIVGDGGLLRHDLVEARDPRQALGDRHGLAADLAPGLDEFPSIWEIPVEVEHGRRLDPAVIDRANDVCGAVVENGQTAPFRPFSRRRRSPARQISY